MVMKTMTTDILLILSLVCGVAVSTQKQVEPGVMPVQLLTAIGHGFGLRSAVFGLCPGRSVLDADTHPHQHSLSPGCVVRLGSLITHRHFLIFGIL
jgi:hypothetical protein